MIKRVLIAVSALAIAGAGALAVVWGQARLDTAGKLRFERPLRIPPLEEGRPGARGERVYDLRVQQGTADLGADVPARTWGVNGPHLGPTLRVRRGERVRMRVRNDLPEPTTMHWHGMHLPAVADGGPHQPIGRGETWTPTWRIDQPAATLWYHPHPHARTEHHVARGVAGMVLVADERERSLALPREYGVDDIPVILQDVRLDDEGNVSKASISFSPIGHLGDRMLVNGTPDPHVVVRRERVRLRLLNASTARIHDVGLADGRPMTLVATDGGLLEHPAEVRRVRLSPGERAEVVVRLRPRERLVLRSHPHGLGGDPWSRRFAGGDDRLDLLQLRAARTLERSPEVPERLAAGPPEPDPAGATRTRRFELSGRTINGRRMDMGRIDEVVRRDETEIWEVSSNSLHSFHIHDVQFRVLEIDGRPPPPALRGPKDTILFEGRSTARLAVRFTDYADPRTPYMFHCHLIDHEDRGMMNQLVVTPP